MGPLTNQRHERFAQAWAEGKTATEAYVLAGYKARPYRRHVRAAQHVVVSSTRSKWAIRLGSTGPAARRTTRRQPRSHRPDARP